MKRQAMALFVVRVFLGIWFVWSAIPKFQSDYRTIDLPGLLPYFAEQGAFPFYKGFLAWAASHVAVFGWLTSVGELAIGVLLILGLLTPIAGGVAIVMCLNYLFATYYLGPAPVGVNFLCIGIAIALILGHAGCRYGVDAKICKHNNE